MFFQAFRSRLQFLERRVVDLDAELSTTRRALDELRAQMATSAPAVLRAEVEDLRLAQELSHSTLAKTLQKLLGRVGGEKTAEQRVNAKPDRDALRSAYLPKPQ